DVASSEDARHRGGAAGIDLDLAEAGQLDVAVLQPIGVGHQADLHEDTGYVDVRALTGNPVSVSQADHLAAVTPYFGGGSVLDDLHVRQRASLALQYFVGTQGVAELQHGHVLDDASQVDGSFDAGVTATDHRHALALEQRAVTVRAVGYALAAVFLLTGDVHLPPAGAGSQDDCAAGQGGATGQGDLDHVIGGQLGSSLFGDHVDIIFLHMLLEAGDQLRAFGVGYGNEVLDTHGVHHLATKALGHQTGANAFTGRVDGCSSASRATTNDQYFIGLLLAQLGGLALGCTGVDLVDDLGQRHAALAKVFAIQEHGGHSHDLAALDLVLEQGAIDHHVGDVRVQGGHQVQRLDHVGAVLAGQGDIGLE